MRYHCEFPALDWWTEAASLRALFHPGALRIARLEPILHRRLGSAVLDLIFASEGKMLVVPAVRVEAGMLLEREGSPLIWPQSVFDVATDAQTDAIQEFLLPWLWSRMRARSLNEEVIRVFDEAARADFEAARARGWLGAAPYRSVVAALAPFWYAARFASGKRGLLASANAALGWRLLGRSAREVRLAFDDPLGTKWFGAPAAALDLQGDFDFAVVDARARMEHADLLARVPDVVDVDGQDSGRIIGVASPVPTDLLMSFDLADAPALATFAVRAREPVLRAPAQRPAASVVGDSGGRIYFALRGDYRIAPDGDVDAAHALAELLRAEGFGVDIGGPLRPRDAKSYDLVHAFGLCDVESLEETLEAASAQSVQVVLSANFEDLADQRWWGEMVAPVAYHSRDEVELGLRLEKQVRRELETAEYVPSRRCALLPDFDDRVRAALRRVAAVFVAEPGEAAILRERFELAGDPIQAAPVLGPEPDPEAIAQIVGTCDFVLAHAPILARTNCAALARAARRERLPLVIAGPVADVHYLERIREYADERMILFPDPSAGQLAALYRRCRVFAEVPWYAYSSARPLRALLAGASVVLSNLSYAKERLRAEVRLADPASEREIGARLREAWSSPRPLAAQATRDLLQYVDSRETVRAIARGYARTLSRASVG